MNFADPPETRNLATVSKRQRRLDFVDCVIAGFPSSNINALPDYGCVYDPTRLLITFLSSLPPTPLVSNSDCPTGAD